MIPEKIKTSVKDTVGYSEAVNKDSFMIGVSVAFHKCEDYYEKDIAALESQMKAWKEAYENTYADMKALVNIINKYQDNG